MGSCDSLHLRGAIGHFFPLKGTNISKEEYVVSLTAPEGKPRYEYLKYCDERDILGMDPIWMDYAYVDISLKLTNNALVSQKSTSNLTGQWSLETLTGRLRADYPALEANMRNLDFGIDRRALDGFRSETFAQQQWATRVP
jgi:hypothetical protein